jgi:DNA-binding NarL/FixJ family response regulator
MRVALADDSALFRDGLAALLRAADIDVSAQARNGPELMACISRDPPDVAILDIRMPPSFTGEGLAIAGQLRARHPHVGILLLSAYAETPLAARLVEIDSGSIGYLLKDRVTNIHGLIDALQRVVAGETVIDSGIVRRLIDRQRKEDPLASLTQRERDILALMAEGRSNAGIARSLSISGRTVEAPIAEIFRKLGIHSASDDNRRVKAVLTWLRANRDSHLFDRPS